MGRAPPPALRTLFMVPYPPSLRLPPDRRTVVLASNLLLLLLRFLGCDPSAAAPHRLLVFLVVTCTIASCATGLFPPRHLLSHQRTGVGRPLELVKLGLGGSVLAPP